jgi:F5/8 type C domain/BNR repeat-like domain
MRAGNRWLRSGAGLLLIAACITVLDERAASAATNTACATAINSTAQGGTGQSAIGYAFDVGGLATAYAPSSGVIAGFPSLSAFDTGTATAPTRSMLSWFSQHPDVLGATVSGALTSHDGGTTFPAASYVANEPGGVQLRDSTLFATDFTQNSITGSVATITVHRSADGGATWQTSTATVTLPAELKSGGLYLAGNPFQLADGTLLLTYYSTFAGYAAQTSYVVASTDGGATFTPRGYVARPASPTDTNAYNETAVAQLPNGGLLAVFRHQVGSTLSTLRYAKSTDGGVSWTAPQDVLVSLDGAAAAARTGVDPALRLLPNGILALSSGRDDDWVAYSTNGQGTGWVGSLTYRNCPTSGTRQHGSSGYTGIAAANTNTLIQVGDNCAPGWGCGSASDSGFTVDAKYRIWRRTLYALTPDVGKIDLATKYRQGLVTVATNLTWTSPAHPRTGIAAAFDGSTDYWSSAVGSRTATGSYVITLDRSYALTRIGLSLRNGRPASARVYTSTDGVTWSGPVTQASARTDLALVYAALPSPVTARYVKIETDTSTDCDPDIGSSCAFLNEVELFSTTDSFENEPEGLRPRGYTDLNQTWTSTYEIGGTSRVALRLDDTSATAPASATWPGSPAASETLQFATKPVTMPGGLLFNINGRNSSGATVAAYHLGVFSDGSLHRWTGSAWVTLSAAGVIPVGSWSTITLSATLSSATLSVNGVQIATGIPRTDTTATTLAGHAFTSAGTAPTGDNILIDDVTDE